MLASSVDVHMCHVFFRCLYNLLAQI